MTFIETIYIGGIRDSQETIPAHYECSDAKRALCQAVNNAEYCNKEDCAKIDPISEKDVKKLNAYHDAGWEITELLGFTPIISTPEAVEERIAEAVKERQEALKC